MSFRVYPQPDACRAWMPTTPLPPSMSPPSPPLVCHMPAGHDGLHSNERRPSALSRRWEGDARPVTGVVPDRRQDERACPHCDGSGIRQFDSDGYEACRCLLPAASPVPGQQREAVARPRWIDGEMREPWFRDLIAGTTAEHAADLTGWAETIAHTYSRSGTLEITAVVWALLDRIDALLAATRDGEQA